MATLISRATGNFTSSGTWEVVDSTSYLDSSAASTAISTSTLDSSAFTPGAITVSGVALKIANRAASPTGTFTVTLRNSTAGSDVTSVTVNVSDLPYYASTSLGFGWVFFKFASSQTLLAATNYLIRVVCSNTGSQVTLYRNATSNNWSRMLATTTTAAPGASDQLIMIGERTGTGSGNSFTVTLDNTATTTFGSLTPPESIVIGQGGTLACGTSAATAYHFRFKGVFHITSGGTYQIGTTGTRIPSDSTCTTYADATSNVDTGLVCDSGGIVTVEGNDKLTYTQLNTDEAASSTVIGLDSTTGWLTNDVLAFGPGNNSTTTEVETKTISTVDSATQVTLTAGLTNAKRGTAPHRTYVINTTRNVIFTGASTTLRGYFSFREYCTATIRYATFTQWGATNTTTGKMGIDLQPHSTGSVTIEYCHFDNPYNNVACISYPTTNKTGTVTIQYNTAYKAGNRFFYLNQASFAALTVRYNCLISLTDTNAPAFYYNDMGQGYLLGGNIISGSPGSMANCIETNDGVGGRRISVNGMFDDTVVTHWNGAALFLGGNADIWSGTISNFEARICSVGIRYHQTNRMMNITLNNCNLWGNSSSGIYLDSPSNDQRMQPLTLRNCTFDGSTWQSQPRGLYAVNARTNVKMYNCSFGQGGTLKTTHSTADVDYSTITYAYHELVTVDCLFGSTTKITGMPATTKLGFIRHQRYNGTAGDHRGDYRTHTDVSWTSRVDTTIFNTASPSEKLTPTVTSTVDRAESAPFYVPVDNGATKTITVYVRKSEAGDGAAYTGSQPRLILKANPSIGIDSDTVLDTMTASTGSWEQLSGTTSAATDDGVFQCVVDFDGSAGFINVDDWSA